MSRWDASSTLYTLAITDTLRKIAAESSRYERGVIDVYTFAGRVGDLLVSLERRFPDGAPKVTTFSPIP